MKYGSILATESEVASLEGESWKVFSSLEKEREAQTLGQSPAPFFPPWPQPWTLEGQQLYHNTKGARNRTNLIRKDGWKVVATDEKILPKVTDFLMLEILLCKQIMRLLVFV